MAQPARSRGCVVTSQSPEHTAADNVGAWDGDEEVEKEDEEEAHGTCVTAGGLLVHCCQWEGDDVGVEDVVEGGDAVELWFWSV
jgi:hypothetical protein